jgi:hypothetical protein
MPDPRPCRSNRILFLLPASAGKVLEQLRQQLIGLGSGKLVYALVTGNGLAEKKGLVRMSPTFLRPREGGVMRWKMLLPALRSARVESAGTKSDVDWRADLVSAAGACGPGTLVGEDVVFEMGEPFVFARGSDAHFQALLSVRSMEEAKELDPEACLKMRFQLKDVISANQQEAARGEPVTQLQRWQWDIHDRLMGQNNRQILFVVDRRGARGKSTLALFLMQRYRESHLSLMTVDKSSDMSHIISKRRGLRSIVFDLPRNCSPSRFPWDTFEALKNGWLASGKYDGDVFFFPGSVKVAVFTNHHPGGEFHRLTGDRISVLDLDLEFSIQGQQYLSQLAPTAPGSLPARAAAVGSTGADSFPPSAPTKVQSINGGVMMPGQLATSTASSTWTGSSPSEQWAPLEGEGAFAVGPRGVCVPPPLCHSHQYGL